VTCLGTWDCGWLETQIGPRYMQGVVVVNALAIYMLVDACR